MAGVCAHYNSNAVRAPTGAAAIYKEECTLCFASIDDEAGVFVCLNCYNGGCEKHARMHSLKRNHPLAVNIRRTKKPQPKTDEKEPPQKITKLAIGVEGGLQIDTEASFDYHTKAYCFGCDKEVDGTNEKVAPVIKGIMDANSAAKQEDLKAWENQIIQCEHTITLQQVENPPKLEQKSLAHCGLCDLNANLWLCLTCGHLGCGRKNYDGTGGNGHALLHADSTGHQVVCKLGTITPEGNADVHCYGCDELRLDPYLANHLGAFGINIANEQKTVKSLAEMELEQNLNLDFAKVLEGGVDLTKTYGAGYTGLKNLGNTCYMASVLQVLFSTTEFQKRYYPTANEHINNCSNDPAKCYHCQMAKLADGLLSGRYSVPPKSEEEEDQPGIPPRMLKSLVCKDHPEFSTMRQQDADEFFQYMLKNVQQKERATKNDPTTAFEFSLQQRLQCTVCKKVRYSSVKQSEVSLPMLPSMAQPPLKPVENEKDSDRFKRERESKIPFEGCLDVFAADEALEFKCPSCNQTTVATKFESFPNLLAVHMRRFLFDNWVPKKFGVKIDVPETLDLESVRGRGKRSDEQELPGGSAKAEESAGPQPNEEVVQMLMSAGFPRVRCEKAALATGNANADMAMNWLFEHMEDADIDEPIKKASKPAPAASNIPEDLIQQLADMGFTPAQAKKALQETQCNMDRAVEWLFSHADEPITEEDTPATTAAPMEVDNAPAKYKLFAFIVHLGPSTHSGHYIAYIKKDGKWVQFNDRKVAFSAEAPIGDAYMYFFQRV